jgi:dTDP-4-amino-4,6-dideoxygalactose transaminase
MRWLIASLRNFPNAEDAYQRAVSLPIWPDMSDADVQYVANTIKRIVQENRPARVTVSNSVEHS